jgi:hypothetical protein
MKGVREESRTHLDLAVLHQFLELVQFDESGAIHVEARHELVRLRRQGAALTKNRGRTVGSQGRGRNETDEGFDRGHIGA